MKQTHRTLTAIESGTHPIQNNRHYDNESIRFRYRVRGRGPDLLLIHGVGSRLEVWDDIVEHLASRYRTISPDLRGHGESDKPPGPYALSDFVTDLVALLDHMGIERCHLAGHSLGGLIGQGFALSHSDRLNRLILLSTVAGRTPQEQERVETRYAMVANGIPGQHFEASVSRWFTERYIRENPDAIAEFARQNRLNDPDAYAASYRVLTRTDLASELHRINIPTLVATGDGDIGSNTRMAQLMHERIPGSSLHIFENLRHNILTEAPQQVAALIDNFLQQA